MTKEHNHSDSPRPRGISRRDFIKLAAAAGLLAGCGPARPPTVTPILSEAEGPTDTPAATSMPTDTPAATSMPTDTPAVTPMPTDAPAPTATSVVTARRPEIIKMYPDAPSKVVRAHHSGVWDGEELATEAIRQMLDASITELTGLNDAGEAWAALFDPGERIAIKVNTISTSDFWTRVPLVMAVAERLQEIGIPAEQITIFDRYTSELEYAGYPINRDGPGVRCHGTDSDRTEGWTIMDTDIALSDILLNCDALINMPILKHHNHSGVTFAMKNHFGTFDKPKYFHRPVTGPAIVELNALAPIRDCTRLVIGDTLTVCPISQGGWFQAVTGDSILMSFDPVAHDTVGLQMLAEVRIAEGHDPEAAIELANPWLADSAALGLGANDPDDMDLVEVTLG